MLRYTRLPLALLATILALGLAACGDDDEDNGAAGNGGAATSERTDTDGATPPGETTTTPAGTETGGEAEGGGAKPPSATTPPEEQEGGAGDEVPASSQALVTGRDGRLSPRTVRVPPFIAIRVQLRSADGVEYELAGGGKSVAAGGEIETAATTFDGLRTGERLVLRGPQGTVTIVANSEPGP
jgi:hypothetical protein